MPRIVWTDEDGFGHGMTIADTSCADFGEHDTVQEHAEAHIAVLTDVLGWDAHIVTEDEAEAAWRDHPARRINGGSLTDDQLRGRMAAFEADDLTPSDLYVPEEWQS